MACGLALNSPGVQGLSPTLRSIALSIVSASGGRVGISSGWRSHEKQTQLYNAWISGNYNVPAVARPGTSHHESGGAVDFCGDLALAQQLGRQRGMIFPVNGEAWHGELGEGHNGDHGDLVNGGIQYNLNYTDPNNQGNPQDILANRMHAIMRILGENTRPQDFDTSYGVDVMNQDLSLAGPPDTSLAAGLVEPTQQIPEAGGRQTGPLGQMGGAGGQSPDAALQSLSGGGVSDPRGFGAYARSKFSQYGWTEADYRALVQLWNKESGDPSAGDSRVTWNNTAQNPNSAAFGIAQFLEGTWDGTGYQKSLDPRVQMDAGMTYIARRYGSPQRALAFHLRNNWY